ncbi:hypothetical protein Salat_1710000 [Sesamum alatum]|uniref:Reverse transcriptase n=1 Tax=Sesamum alatum TaxID=300844 RepID=A0AAE1Y8J2_9LAMI|nr:hypothetical protein Salat_1710000 [Sesamum alatum]
MSVRHLARSTSDHCPLLIQAKLNVTTGPSAFRFQNMWNWHPDFLEVVKGCWSFPTIGVGIAELLKKLKRLKHHLKDWNKLVFGDIFTNLKLVESTAFEAERHYDRCRRTPTLWT